MWPLGECQLPIAVILEVWQGGEADEHLGAQGQAQVSAAALKVRDPELHPRALSLRQTPHLLSTPVRLLQLHWAADKIPSSSAIGKMV